MKVDARRAAEVLRDVPSVRVVLLHGDDEGMIHDLASRFVRAAAGSLDDPFRVVELDRGGHGRVPDEFRSVPLTGGRRVVRVREVGDAMLLPVQSALSGAGTALLVLEAPGMGTRAKLRMALEKAADAVTIACYPPDDAALGSEITAALQLRGMTADGDATQWLVSRLGADLALTRSEVEKLSLYVGASKRVDMASAQACVWDASGLSVDDALFAATAGDPAAADRALELALEAGATPVGVIRMALLHVQRLHRARIALDAGGSPRDAMKAVRPPVIFTREPAFLRALSDWSEPALAASAEALWQSDGACKRTGAPAESICRRAIMGLVQKRRSMR